MTGNASGGVRINIDAALLAYLIPALGPAYILRCAGMMPSPATMRFRDWPWCSR